ncbi:SCO6745 family protein [Sciscionella sediminilitoris]|uniref:SCO6745 family protein n=1 Tax=Sciscionella sediminilitoris TaxID=1445613 RepID=UPI0004DF473F|nr:hypothetical protein [Sciscionella sp. SE31]
MDSNEELASVARDCWQLLELLHIPVYFAPEAAEEFGKLGLEPRAGYFASRAGGFGAVGAPVIAATFYTFSTEVIEAAIPAAWRIVSPEQVLAARYRGVGASLRRVFTDEQVREAAGLVRELAAGLNPRGRALFGAHAGLDWPEDPVLALWHGATLVREHRGDGHIAALLANGVSPVDACITAAVHKGQSLNFHQKLHGWPEEEWQAGLQGLIGSGLLASESELTERGTALRESLEQRTDELATEGWEGFGAESGRRLRGLLEPLVAELRASEVLPKAFRG